MTTAGLLAVWERKIVFLVSTWPRPDFCNHLGSETANEILCLLLCFLKVKINICIKIGKKIKYLIVLV